MQARLLIVTIAFLIAACAPQSDLDAANKKIEDLMAENAQLKEQLAKKPDIPVKVSFRRAMMGPGYVAIFDTTIKKTVPVLVTVNSASLGTTKKFELHLNPAIARELGHMEGATIGAGDTVTLENNEYSPATYQINP